ncbi:MAG: alpha-1,4-glucan--maltose-1-phosphate maltosyltransferase [Flavobacteriales bacterium]|nr:alpha-1,4-glucan--maltose-1-phosphate maltosyltransferase [Flavobacteriales bacterium]
MKKTLGQVRTVIRNVYPQVAGGKYAIKRVVDETVQVWADVFADGHDVVRAALEYRHESDTKWSESPAESIGMDRWTAQFQVTRQGRYEYRFIGWTDSALYWLDGLIKKADAGVDIELEIEEGRPIITHLIRQASKEDKPFLNEAKEAFSAKGSREDALTIASSPRFSALLHAHPKRPFIARSETFPVYVDREKARFSTWYEFFPRSAGDKEGVHGTLKDVIKRLPRVAELGFDTLYLPPIHPIGEIDRKGKNNTTVAADDDVGSCWGIGSKHGGHTEVHPDLGAIQDFKRLVKEANKLGIEIAMDYALQAAPDHPWVTEHKDWFKVRPDGSIQYAENPPKKYQDIFPINFETKDWKAMWDEFHAILVHWIDLGVRIFRVDNPHTKPFGFWEWIIATVKEEYPDVLFLSEAFTRPAVMQELGQLGFTQSYTYFTWRNTKHELIEYIHELTSGLTSETFRPNFWPNTPDINPWSLQNPDEHQYRIRYFLAATLSSNCGVYGPVYELMDHQAVSGKEEYWNSEKFQLRHWDWKARNAITETYTKVNQARKDQPALQQTNHIEFVHMANENLMAYLKTGSDGSQVLCVVNLDGHHPQSAQLELNPERLGKSYDESIHLKDLMDGSTYEWRGDSHYIQLDREHPFHLFALS